MFTRYSKGVTTIIDAESTCDGKEKFCVQGIRAKKTLMSDGNGRYISINLGLSWRQCIIVYIFLNVDV